HSYISALLASASGGAVRGLDLQSPLAAAALDSLQAGQLAARIADELDVALPFVELLQDGTLATFIEHLFTRLHALGTPVHLASPLASREATAQAYPL